MPFLEIYQELFTVLESYIGTLPQKIASVLKGLCLSYRTLLSHQLQDPWSLVAFPYPDLLATTHKRRKQDMNVAELESSRKNESSLFLTEVSKPQDKTDSVKLLY